MTAGTASVHRHSMTFAGDAWVRYECARPCLFSSDWHRQRDDDLAQGVMREHIEAAHPELVPEGPCAQCGRRTDHFKAVVPGVGVMFGCEQCAPTQEEMGLGGDD